MVLHNSHLYPSLLYIIIQSVRVSVNLGKKCLAAVPFRVTMKPVLFSWIQIRGINPMKSLLAHRYVDCKEVENIVLFNEVDKVE